MFVDVYGSKCVEGLCVVYRTERKWSRGDGDMREE